MISVICWLWKQSRSLYNYSAEDVDIWASMVRRNLSIPHRLVCVTDMPEGIDSAIEILPLPELALESKHWPIEKGFPQCYRRLHMWGPSRVYGERFACMDLDCVVTGSLDPLFSRTEDVVLCPGTRRRTIYNGSMLLMTAGARPQVWDRISPEEIAEASKAYLGSDQAFLASVLGVGEAIWTEADGVYQYSVQRFPAPIRNKRNLARGRRAFPDQVADPKPPENMRILFCPGAYKPRELKDTYPFIREHYQ